MKSITVLGNGQLGRMLRQAGEPLGIKVYPVGIEAQPASIPWQDSLITAEIERWPVTALTEALARHPEFINRDIFPRLADRLSQKQLLDQLQLATAPWQALETRQQWPSLFEQLGPSTIVKSRTGGYDGRGQWPIAADNLSDLPAEIYGQAIVEQRIAFDSELSLVAARARDNSMIFYPLTNNFHQSGILRASVALPVAERHLQAQAEAMLTSIMTHLDYVGVMAMECFRLGDRLLINELAPRVHNSGHWTQNGASISQFELHLRALLDLPLPTPIVAAPALMINLLGIEANMNWLADPLVHLHWYEKEVRPGRKVGHLNLNGPADALTVALDRLNRLLPEDYQASLSWAKQRITQLADSIGIVAK